MSTAKGAHEQAYTPDQPGDDEFSDRSENDVHSSATLDEPRGGQLPNPAGAKIEDLVETALLAAAMTAEDIRHVAFGMHKGGYSPEHVDAALERLEDAFAARERDLAALIGGEQSWMADAESAADVLVARLSRPPGHRFARTSVLAVGYKRVDVDRLANKLTRYFHDGRELTVDEVRTAVFRPERGGYQETQVDRVLDSVVDVMLAVR